jgi:hypothetical protein
MTKKNVLSCPYCEKTFLGARAAQARGGHIRYKHPSGQRGKNDLRPEVARNPSKPTPISIESRSSPDNYIEQTLEQIDRRRDSIRSELERFEALRAESERLDQARQALQEVLETIRRPPAKTEATISVKRKVDSRSAA